MKKTSPFPFSDDNKRYLTWNYYLKHKYGLKVCKLSLSGGFTCPNRDGTKGAHGCTFCSGDGSGTFAGDYKEDILSQIESQKKLISKKWPKSKYLAYFQPFSGTYAPLNKLKPLYTQALEPDDILGLCIATRPDCLEKDVCLYLNELNKSTDLYIELGLQTIHDETAAKLNRCHTYADFLDGYGALTSMGIKVCVHIINGLPGETYDMMMQTAKEIARIKPFAVKIHNLHIIEGTKISKQYSNGEFSLLSRDDSINLVCDQLEILPSEIVIERLTGDGSAKDLIAPLWSIKKLSVLNDIDKELARRNSFQGIKYSHI